MQRRSLVLALLSLVLAAGGAARAEVKFLTHSLNNSTYISSGGMLRGKPHTGRRAFYVEVVMAMMQARGAVSRIEEVPLSRGLFLVGREKNFALFNIIKNRDRIGRFKWVGPISVFPTYFYEHIDAPTGVRSIEDAKKVPSICVLRGNNLEQNLRDKGFTNIFLANSNDSCVHLLGYRRVSLIPESRYPWFMNDPVLSRILVRTPVVLSIDEGYVAFSPNVADTEIAAWQKALDTIKKNGRYESIVNTFLISSKDAKAETFKVPAEKKPRLGHDAWAPEQPYSSD
ncbi:hypothetical protein [Kordiimonas marina]|uniref:hypothetical protein n=1 Tax=Kordiimonas marina TaxID=2872312 RepID=UPI001FF4611A|nr:hypothetical protein [Kordiimonas marina]MCJ9430552.1 hypothetical protein [Kordiimonas marina]